MNLATALMVSPANIPEERTVTVTNNLKETASYTISSECAEISEPRFELEPAERKEVTVKPKCNGYVQVSEETETAINRFNIPTEYEQAEIVKKKTSLMVPLTVLCVVLLALLAVGRKLIKNGGTATASVI